MPRTSLRENSTHACVCFREKTLKNCDRVSGSYFYRVKKGAEKRNIVFKLNIEDAAEILKKQNFKCALSGISLITILKYSDRHQHTASIDRIDSNNGYTKDNIQWVHKDINVMKMSLSQENFLNYCRLITENNKK